MNERTLLWGYGIDPDTLQVRPRSTAVPSEPRDLSAVAPTVRPSGNDEWEGSTEAARDAVGSLPSRSEVRV